MKSIAVIITTFNGQKFIHDQLTSIMNQTLPPDEVIISDDRSTDNSVKIATDFINHYGLHNHWQVHVNDKNLGYSKNFHQAIRTSNADIIFLCDQDDIWDEKKISMMMEVLDRNIDINLLCCKHDVIDEHGVPLKGLLIEKHKNTCGLQRVSANQILSSYKWPGMAMAFRKSFYYSLQSEGLKAEIPHDFFLSLVAADKETFWEFDYVGVYHRRHANNAAKEEHRIMKNLNLSRKRKSVTEYVKMLESIDDMKLPLSDETKTMVSKRLQFSKDREAVLKERSILGLLRLYFIDKLWGFNIRSFLADALVVCFG